LQQVIFIVACCHSVKLCALAARAFRSPFYFHYWVVCQEKNAPDGLQEQNAPKKGSHMQLQQVSHNGNKHVSLS